MCLVLEFEDEILVDTISLSSYRERQQASVSIPDVTLGIKANHDGNSNENVNLVPRVYSAFKMATSPSWKRSRPWERGCENEAKNSFNEQYNSFIFSRPLQNNILGFRTREPQWQIFEVSFWIWTLPLHIQLRIVLTPIYKQHGTRDSRHNREIFDDVITSCS